MTRSAHVTAAPYALAAIGLISCSMLMYEILLTRICALRLYFHFGYLVVSNCCTVIGSVATVILSMNFGFQFVMVAAVVVYSAAFVTLRRLPT